MHKRILELPVMTLVCFAISLCGLAKADEVLNFNANGTFSNGDSLGGTVTIDVTTGSVTAANLITTGPAPYTFDTNFGEATYGSTAVVIADANTPTSYPIIFLGTTQSNLVGYLGGAIVSGSNYQFGDGSGVTLTSGTFTLATPNNIETFDASGTFTNGDVLGGDVVIDTTTGNIIQADLTTTGPAPYTFDTNFGEATYGSTAVVVADANTPTSYPIIFLGTTQSSLVGYQGGAIVSGSNYQFGDGSGVSLASGAFTAAPEPSTLTSALSTLTMGAIYLSFVSRKRGICKRMNCAKTIYERRVMLST